MIISYGTEEYIDNKKKLVRYNFFKDEQDGGRERHLRPRHPADAPRARAQGGGRGLRPREARHPPARPGRLVEEHDRAPPQAGRRAATRARPTARSTRSSGSNLAGTGHRRAHEIDRFPSPMNEEPLRLIPPEWRAKAIERARPLERPVQGPRRRRPRPGEPLHLQAPDARSTTATGRRWSQNHIRVPRLVLEREGPRRHRHLPAEGREEPGLDRAHRRHQLPEDRRVRLGLATRARSTSTASSTSPTAASSSSSRCSSSTSRSSTICSARRRSTRSSRRSSRRRTSTRSSSATRTRPSTRSS